MLKHPFYAGQGHPCCYTQPCKPHTMQGWGLENVHKRCTGDDESRGLQAAREMRGIVILKEQRREVRLLDLVSPCSSGASFPFDAGRNQPCWYTQPCKPHTV
ncbi:hypothetical protein Acr_01g0014000 [Actinidia rufa]|uniref:Uncharacterized protein n=1 Tax=Actinidia rufa TaxID=165716 RepID=A0A7J0E520_9ERIC|nr:hypothetical protein Acr_01g0014000 [Actinidia rufa]